MAKVDLADYLFKRLYQIGVRAVHGVPGNLNKAPHPKEALLMPSHR